MKLTINKLTIQLENKKRKSFKIQGGKIQRTKKGCCYRKNNNPGSSHQTKQEFQKKNRKGKKDNRKLSKKSCGKFPRAEEKLYLQTEKFLRSAEEEEKKPYLHTVS